MPGPNARVVGRYALYDAIASGGMATVHFGQLLGPVGFSRLVAIKRLLPQHAKNPEFVKMFLDEVRVASRVRHPNVVSTLDVVMEEGELFLVLDYVQGETFARLIKLGKNGRPTDPAIVAAIVTDLLHGLHAAHESKDYQGRPLQLVHRDVSPQNVLVGVDGVARVLDFGIAKAKGRLQLTMDGQLKGKLAYMPPEQLSGRFVDRRSDIYAAAIVLWEGLTGQRLFDGKTEADVMEKISAGDVSPPRNVVASLPKALDEITLCGLAMDPSNRFQTAHEMARAIESEVRLASRSDISDWVATTAAESLAHHAELIDQIEQLMAGSDVGHAFKLLTPTVRPGSNNTPQGQFPVAGPPPIEEPPPPHTAEHPATIRMKISPTPTSTTSQPFVTQKLNPIFYGPTPSDGDIEHNISAFKRMGLKTKVATIGGVIAIAAVTAALIVFNRRGVLQPTQASSEAAVTDPPADFPPDLSNDDVAPSGPESDPHDSADPKPAASGSRQWFSAPKVHRIKGSVKTNHTGQP